MMQFGKRITDYIDRVCRGIHSPKERAAFRAELTDHLAEKILELMREQKLTQEQAETEALRCIGDAKKVSDGLNRVHNDRAWVVWKYVCLAITCFLGFEIFIAPYLFLFAPYLSILNIPGLGPSVSSIPENVGVIGGADGPTAIYVTSSPSFFPPLILFFLFLGLTMFLFLYPVLRQSRQQRKK